MNENEREQVKQDALELILIREGLSVLTGLLVFWLLTSPKVRMWLDGKAWEYRQYRGRNAARVESMVAELQRDISRIEHGQVDL